MKPRSASRDWPEYLSKQSQKCKDSRLKAFYQVGCPAGDTPLSEIPFVALDFETTGLNAEKDGIVSIGVVPFDLNRIRVRDAQHWLLKPRQGLNEESVVFHGITHSDLTDAPDLDTVLESVLTALAGKIVVVHYRYIEREFLKASLVRRLGEGVIFPMVDTMELEAELHRRPLSMLCSKLMGKKPSSIRLADSRKRYGLPHYASHNAVVDAMATAELFQAQVSHRFDRNTAISRVWV